MRSQEPENDEAHSSDPLAIKAIIPEKVQRDGREQIVIAFNHRLPVKPKGQFVVDFEGTAGAVQVSAKQLNSSTLILETPEYAEASVVTASVYHGIHRRFLGQHSFEFLSRNDTFYRLLYGALDPVKFMCESLRLTPADIQDLDCALAETFRTNAPEGFNLLGIHKNVAGGEASAEHPTLLHFASQFGLSRLINNLLHYPGAQEACSIKNYLGQWPYNIAEDHGFHDLANILRTFRDQGDPDEIYTDMEPGDENFHYVEMQKDDGSYYYTRMDGEGHKLYVDMKGKRYINLEDEDGYYTKMQKEDGSYHYVRKKGEAAGKGGKIYDVCTERSRQYPPVQDPPESDQYPSEELYENFQTGTTPATDQDGELYETMDRNPEGQENPDELYIDMNEDPSAIYTAMESGQMSDEYVRYDKPKSNLPVNPEPGFYRSASSAAEIIRAKEIENQRKTQSLPPPRSGMSQVDILRDKLFALGQSAVKGNLTNEEVAELLKSMQGTSESASTLPRRGSTSSRSSTSTTGSYGSTGSSGVHSAHEHQEPTEDIDNEDENIHATLEELFPKINKHKQKFSNDDTQAQMAPKDAPPPLPPQDYERKENTTESPGAKKHHPRSLTMPVNTKDLPPPPPVARRRSDPHATAGSGLDFQSKAPSKKHQSQHAERLPAPIPESELSRPQKSPPPTAARRPLSSLDSSRPPAPLPQPVGTSSIRRHAGGVPVFPEEPPPQLPQRVPRPAPRGTPK